MAKKTDVEVKAVTPAVQPKTKYRNQMETESHLFKAELARCLKVDKWGAEKVKRVEHVHFFHSHNSQGKEMTQTAAVGGHIHEVSYGVDSDGNWVAKCGPPLRKVTRLVAGVPRVKYEKITYKNPDYTGDNDEILVDDHTHEMTYRGSEKLSTARVQEIQRENYAAVGRPNVEAHTAPKVPEGFDVRDTDAGRGQE